MGGGEEFVKRLDEVSRLRMGDMRGAKAARFARTKARSGPGL